MVRQDSDRMTTQLTWKEMTPCSPAKLWSGSADRDGHNSLAYDSASVKFVPIIRSVIKGLVMIVAFALPLVVSLVRVQDDVERSVATSVESRGQGSRVQVENYSQNASSSDGLHDSFEQTDAVESTAFDLPPFDYRSWVDTEETADSIWASSDVPAPIWIEWVSRPSSESEFRLSNTDSSATGFDNTEQEIDETVPVTEASRLARLTVYWPEEGDHDTRRRMSATGVYLRDGHCAVDPKVIPYGSVVKIPGMGKYVAVDTGPAVVSRRAAQSTGRSSHERNALVVDIFCSSRSKAQEFQENAPEFAVITWYR
jgi:3D (Asp-Asp-Asp) domain-containing protein